MTVETISFWEGTNIAQVTSSDYVSSKLAERAFRDARIENGQTGGLMTMFNIATLGLANLGVTAAALIGGVQPETVRRTKKFTQKQAADLKDGAVDLYRVVTGARIPAYEQEAAKRKIKKLGFSALALSFAIAATSMLGPNKETVHDFVQDRATAIMQYGDHYIEDHDLLPEYYPDPNYDEEVAKTQARWAEQRMARADQLGNAAGHNHTNGYDDSYSGASASAGAGVGMFGPILDNMKVTSHFSPARTLFGKTRAHNGTDYAAKLNQPVKSAKGGEVVFAGRQNGYGNVVIVQSGPYTIKYAHLNRIDVVEGDHISKGITIGGAGSTGRSTGVHVHFEILKDGKHLNPETVYAAQRAKAAQQNYVAHAANGKLKVLPEWLQKAAAPSGIGPVYLHATISVESNFDPKAHSGKARGLMQITPDTARTLAKKLHGKYPEITANKIMNDQYWNVVGGAEYLHDLLIKAKGNPYIAAAGYNAGPAYMKKWFTEADFNKGAEHIAEKIPFEETSAHVRKIAKFMAAYEAQFSKASAAQQADATDYGRDLAKPLEL